MRSRHVCPKCGGVDLLVIEQALQPVVDSNGRQDTRVYAGLVTKEHLWGVVVDQERVDIGHIELWICDACGYMESYARDFEQLRELAGRVRRPAPPRTRPALPRMSSSSAHDGLESVALRIHRQRVQGEYDVAAERAPLLDAELLAAVRSGGEPNPDAARRGQRRQRNGPRLGKVRRRPRLAAEGN